MKRLWSTALVALLLDAGTKLAAALLLRDATVSLWPVAQFYVTHNTGMAFGMLAGNLAANVLLPLAVIAGGWLMMRRYCITCFTAVACGLILGGFAGNFIQRILQGYVLDMIYLPWLPWFVCNVADICICFGVALLAISLVARPQDWEEKPHAKDGK